MIDHKLVYPHPCPLCKATHICVMPSISTENEEFKRILKNTHIIYQADDGYFYHAERVKESPEELLKRENVRRLLDELKEFYYWWNGRHLYGTESNVEISLRIESLASVLRDTRVVLSDRENTP